MLGRPLLFLSSYAPLFALLAIRFEQRWLWISCTALAVLGGASLWLLLRLDARSAPGPHVLASVRDAGGEAASYLATYLLPFLTVATPTVRDVLAYVGFLVIAAVIDHRVSDLDVDTTAIANLTFEVHVKVVISEIQAAGQQQLPYVSLDGSLAAYAITVGQSPQQRRQCLSIGFRRQWPRSKTYLDCSSPVLLSST